MKQILLLLMLPFIGCGQITLSETKNIFGEEIKRDTIPVYLMVSDTSLQKRIETVYEPDTTWAIILPSYEVSTKVKWRSNTVYFKDHSLKVIEGYLTRDTIDSYLQQYLDDKKKPLSKNYIVWQTKKR